MDTLEKIFFAMPWYGWIAVVAILAGCVKSIVQMTHEHEERMERIRLGYPLDGEESEAA